jgi:hypothetical protein
MKDLRPAMGTVFIVLALIAITAFLLQPTVIDGFIGTCAIMGCGPDQRTREGKTYATCADPYRCINGFCKGQDPPILGTDTGLPVRPARYTFEVPVTVPN